MPSEKETTVLEERLRRARDAFRSSLALTLEELRGLLDEQPQDAAAPGSDEARDLGSFADQRIDATRFAALLVHTAPVSSAMTSGNLREEVARALAGIGRAFAASRRVARLRTSPEPPDGAPPTTLPFRDWTRSERDLAPPLLVRLAGADLYGEGLAEFMDGGLRLVLLAEGDAPPAPLVRLVTPGCFVLQTSDPAALARVLDVPGPGVAALLPEEAARFVHDPAGGARLDERLVVESLPEKPPTTRRGGRSARQQADDLRQLATLAAAAPAGTESPDGAAPADMLAAWLLTQADLREL
ncbi:MAG: hypothetical protein ACYTG2_18455 [Planctomycetota bacterium]|jgi:hypothetical protein